MNRKPPNSLNEMMLKR